MHRRKIIPDESTATGSKFSECIREEAERNRVFIVPKEELGERRFQGEQRFVLRQAQLIKNTLLTTPEQATAVL
jgi:hypothetical protein